MGLTSGIKIVKYPLYKTEFMKRLWDKVYAVEYLIQAIE